MQPLICHIVYRLDYGGLENGLVNLINTMPQGAFQHVIISLTEITDFAQRITCDDVELVALGKSPGKDPNCYFRLFSVLRKLRPDIVHTRNLGTLDCQFIAFLAGIRHRIHGEHGWDVHDPNGATPRYVRMRRLLDRFVDRYIVLSGEIENWLTDRIGVDSQKVSRICNGVDIKRFVARSETSESAAALTFGTVIRFAEIKNPLGLIGAFAQMADTRPQRTDSLLLVGDGPEFSAAQALCRRLKLERRAVFAGAQMDTSSWFQKMDVFVLASHREGISNTILEAMASGLPVIATDTGGNPELVADGETGLLVQTDDRNALAGAMEELALNPGQRIAMGKAGRARCESQFSLTAMTNAYADVYRNVLYGDVIQCAE